MNPLDALLIALLYGPAILLGGFLVRRARRCAGDFYLVMRLGGPRRQNAGSR